jgi:hypothetical protein
MSACNLFGGTSRLVRATSHAGRLGSDSCVCDQPEKAISKCSWHLAEKDNRLIGGFFVSKSGFWLLAYALGLRNSAPPALHSRYSRPFAANLFFQSAFLCVNLSRLAVDQRPIFRLTPLANY